MEIYSYLSFLAGQLQYLSGNEVKMLIYILNEMNRHYWRPVDIPESSMLAALNISRPTFFDCREKLVVRKLIYYQPNGRYAPTYSIQFHNIRRQVVAEWQAMERDRQAGTTG